MKTIRKTITLDEHRAIAPQIMDMQKRLDDLSYAPASAGKSLGDE